MGFDFTIRFTNVQLIIWACWDKGHNVLSFFHFELLLKKTKQNKTKQNKTKYLRVNIKSVVRERLTS